ncbi:unnamed protein product [Anisakis simplex]|uniref:Putative zinc finger protein (inferred by orthology to a C. elegans protein) n=1 Tax=Anisakis simplex TaxID=6269 RepID=A0A0M3K3Y6_ANISI|nr:unnamed protein product [Anisakis simplex]
MAFAHRTKHQCHLCAYSSSVKAELKKHIVANHENGVRCTIDGCNITIAYNRLKRHIQEVHQAKHDVKAKRRCAETELEPEQRQGISSRTVEQKHDLETTDDGDMIETTSANQTAGLPSDHNSSKDLDKGDLIAKQRDEMADCNDENNNAMRSSPVAPELHSNDSKQDSLSGNENSKSDGADSLSSCSSGKSRASCSEVPSCVATCSSVLDGHHKSVGDADGGAESDGGSFGSRRGQEDSWDEEFELTQSERTTREDGRIDTEDGNESKVDDGIRQGDFKCAICGRCYRSHRDEKRHYRRVHERSYNETVQRKKKLACPQDGCSKVFSLLAKLREHQACHNGNINGFDGEAIISCDNCERKFKNRAVYAMDWSEAIISCDNCERKFKNRAVYATHLRRYHQMSIRDVNCSPHFVTMLDCKAAQRSSLCCSQNQRDHDGQTIGTNRETNLHLHPDKSQTERQKARNDCAIVTNKEAVNNDCNKRSNNATESDGCCMDAKVNCDLKDGNSLELGVSDGSSKDGVQPEDSCDSLATTKLSSSSQL